MLTRACVRRELSPALSSGPLPYKSLTDDVRVFGSALSRATISRAYNDSRSSHMVDMVLRLNGTGEAVNLPNTTIVGGPYVRPTQLYAVGAHVLFVLHELASRG